MDYSEIASFIGSIYLFVAFFSGLGGFPSEIQAKDMNLCLYIDVVTQL